jgi:hypothetical protein
MDKNLIGRDGRTDGRVCPSVAVTTLVGPLGLHESLNGIPKTTLTKGDRRILEIGIKGFPQLLYRCSLLRLPFYDTYVQNSGDKASYSIVPCIFSGATSIDVPTLLHSELVWFLAPVVLLIAAAS